MATQIFARPKKLRPPQISRDAWESFKGDISRLYLEERKTLEEVRIEMEETLGFVATKSQYIRMVNEVWCLKKNLKKEDVQCLESREKKRAREDKKTGVKVGGRKLNESELRRKRSRHYVSVLEQQRQRITEAQNPQAIEPNTPKGLEMYTPTPSVASPTPTDVALVRSPYRGGLSPSPAANTPHAPYSPFGLITSSTPPSPILGAMEQLSIGTSTAAAPLSPFFNPNDHIALAFSANWTPQILSPNTAESWDISEVTLLPRQLSPATSQLYDTILSGASEYLRPLILYNPLIKATPSMGFAVTLESYMKELFEGNDDALALATASKNYPVIQEILSPQPFKKFRSWSWRFPPCGLVESPSMAEALCFLKTYMVRLSNKVDDAGTARGSMNRLFESGFVKAHKRIIEAILQYARAKKIQRKRNSPHHSHTNHETGFELVADSFAIDLLYGAARAGDTDTVTILLHNGLLQKGGASVYGSKTHEIGTTAIQFAMSALLLRQGFDVNTPPVSDLSPSLLWTAVMTHSKDLVRDLVHTYGAQDTEKQIDFASTKFTRYRDELFFMGQYRISTRLDLFQMARSGVKNALELSVALDASDCLRALLPPASHQGFSDYLGPAGISRLQTIAVLHHSHRTIHELLTNPHFRGQTASHFALALSISTRNVPAIEKLLKYGADLEKADVVLRDSFIGTTPDRIEDFTCNFPMFVRLLRAAGLLNVLETVENINRLLATPHSPSIASSNLANPASNAQVKVYTLRRLEGLSVPGIITKLRPLARDYSAVCRLLCANYVALLSTFSQSIDIETCPNSGPDLQRLDIDHKNHAKLMVKSYGPWSLDQRPKANHPVNFTRSLFQDIWGISMGHPRLCPQDLGPSIPYNSSLGPQFGGNLSRFTISTNLCEPSGSRYTFASVLSDAFENSTRVHTQGDCSLEKRTWQTPFEIIKQRFPPQYYSLVGKDIQSWPSAKPENERWLLEVLGGVTTDEGINFEYITDWAWRNYKDKFNSRLCAAFIPLVPGLNNIQLRSLLRLAVQSDSYDTAQKIIELNPTIKICQKVLHEAVHSKAETFDLILGQWTLTSSDNDAVSFELLLLITIATGDLYKTNSLIPFADLDYDYGLEITPLGVAVTLGKLDICKVLLESGASKYLASYRRRASEKGYYAIEKLLHEAEKKDGRTQNSTTGTRESPICVE
ncbi:hypothetical protein TWF730_011283 [Orbilia blumenaviensis]|uniref:Clr5 domain-containing protein n=1 Tax=Orbilia blumenaviensis TaxID=1796055 RepID=A0AAV9ULH5_9PEZI